MFIDLKKLNVTDKTLNVKLDNYSGEATKNLGLNTVEDCEAIIQVIQKRKEHLERE